MNAETMQKLKTLAERSPFEGERDVARRKLKEAQAKTGLTTFQFSIVQQFQDLGFRVTYEHTHTT